MTDTTSVFERPGIPNPMAMRNLQVLSVAALTSSITRVRLGGPETSGMVADGPSDHIRLVFPDGAEGTPPEIVTILTGSRSNADGYPFLERDDITIEWADSDVELLGALQHATIDPNDPDDGGRR